MDSCFLVTRRRFAAAARRAASCVAGPLPGEGQSTGLPHSMVRISSVLPGSVKKKQPSKTDSCFFW